MNVGRSKLMSEENQTNSTEAPSASKSSIGQTFARERRYIVVKISDADKYLGRANRALLNSLVRVCEESRGRPLECVVVESDWPEYEPTWRAIEARVTNGITAEALSCDVLTQEIAAHEELRGTHKRGIDFEDGFIAGLRYVQDIVVPLLAPITANKP